jgi:hypothetical protein
MMKESSQFCSRSSPLHFAAYYAALTAGNILLVEELERDHFPGYALSAARMNIRVTASHAVANSSATLPRANARALRNDQEIALEYDSLRPIGLGPAAHLCHHFP